MTEPRAGEDSEGFDEPDVLADLLALDLPQAVANQAFGEEPKSAPSGRFCPGCGKPCKGKMCTVCHGRKMGRANTEGRKTWEAKMKIPEHWQGLPESTDPRPDILWAYNNLHHIKIRVGRPSLIYFGLCSEPPSRAAHAQLSFAATNPAAFQQRLDRATGNDDSGKREEDRREEKTIEYLEGVLRQTLAEEAGKEGKP